MSPNNDYYASTDASVQGSRSWAGSSKILYYSSEAWTKSCTICNWAEYYTGEAMGHSTHPTLHPSP